MAQNTKLGQDSSKVTSDGLTYGMTDNPQDPANLLPQIQVRREQRGALISKSPFGNYRDKVTKWKENLRHETGLQLGITLNSMVQGLSRALPDQDYAGVATTFDFLVTWELVNRGKPNQGQVFLQVEGRWEYGTTGPMNLGPRSLGSKGFTANTYARYNPTFLPFRNLYWQQGSKEAGWVYRVGRVTVDQTFSTSLHISPVTTFFPISGTGPFAIGLSDTGTGVSGSWHISDRMQLLGAIADANGNRQDMGDVFAGDFFVGLEYGIKIHPRTAKAGYSKLTLWHTDGTKDGKAINGSLGPEGWGFFVKLEQEITADGRMVALVRYGQSFQNSAMFRKLAAVHWLLYDPQLIGHIQNDLVGVAVNWIEATEGVRPETNAEAFYRFPLVSSLDVTLSYQAIFDPAMDLGIDFASVFSLRITTSF